jgi:hypothetical protein
MRNRALAALVGVILFCLFAMMPFPRSVNLPSRDDATPAVPSAANPPPLLEVAPMPQYQAAGPAATSANREARARKMQEMRLARERRHPLRSLSLEERRAIDAVAEQRKHEVTRRIEASEDSYSYKGAGFGATFDPEGVSFTDRARISLDRLRCGEQELARGDRVQPSLDAADRAVVYDRGHVRERYIVLPDAIEQTFVIEIGRAHV